MEASDDAVPLTEGQKQAEAWGRECLAKACEMLLRGEEPMTVGFLLTDEVAVIVPIQPLGCNGEAWSKNKDDVRDKSFKAFKKVARAMKATRACIVTDAYMTTIDMERIDEELVKLEAWLPPELKGIGTKTENRALFLSKLEKMFSTTQIAQMGFGRRFEAITVSVEHEGGTVMITQEYKRDVEATGKVIGLVGEAKAMHAEEMQGRAANFLPRKQGRQ